MPQPGARRRARSDEQDQAPRDSRGAFFLMQSEVLNDRFRIAASAGFGALAPDSAGIGRFSSTRGEAFSDRPPPNPGQETRATGSLHSKIGPPRTPALLW